MFTRCLFDDLSASIRSNGKCAKNLMPSMRASDRLVGHIVCILSVTLTVTSMELFPRRLLSMRTLSLTYKTSFI